MVGVAVTPGKRSCAGACGVCAKAERPCTARPANSRGRSMGVILGIDSPLYHGVAGHSSTYARAEPTLILSKIAHSKTGQPRNSGLPLRLYSSACAAASCGRLGRWFAVAEGDHRRVRGVGVERRVIGDGRADGGNALQRGLHIDREVRLLALLVVFRDRKLHRLSRCRNNRCPVPGLGVPSSHPKPFARPQAYR